MYAKYFKRVLDLFFSVAALIILLPLLLVLTIVGAVAMCGNPFFTQLRPGKIDPKTGREKIFRLVKFRTMSNKKDKGGKLLPDELRLNKYGRILRSTSLDELPELWNILKGDMSFVGPRPERPCFYAEFETYIHGFSNRLDVTPGLTGLAQVNGGYELAPEQKIIYDMEYIRNGSIRMDLKCLLMTFRVVITQKGAR